MKRNRCKFRRINCLSTANYTWIYRPHAAAADGIITSESTLEVNTRYNTRMPFLTDSDSDLDEQPCCTEIHPQALCGFELFDARKYFEAHEALENAWRAEPGPLRDLYRAVLQVGVGYYHIQQENYTGALKMFRRSRAWLDLFPAHCLNIDLVQFRQDISAVEDEVIRRGPHHLQDFPEDLFKPLPFLREF